MDIITTFPTLSVDELEIRLSQLGDAQSIVDYFINNRHFLAPWEPKREAAFFSVESWQRRLMQLSQLQRRGLAFYFLIVAKKPLKQVIGIISYNPVNQYPFYCANVGYSLADNCQGKGVMRRALALTNAWLFDEVNLHRITASYMPRNQRSASVLASLGFEIEGQAKDYLLINGRWEDHVLTSLINPDWRNAQRDN